MDGRLSLLVRFGDSQTIELSAMLDELRREVQSDDDTVVPERAASPVRSRPVDLEP